MKQSSSFTYPSWPKYVCKLHTALYGLKQAPWALYFNLLTEGFFHNYLDSSLFICEAQDPLVFVLIYVDDIIDTGHQAH